MNRRLWSIGLCLVMLLSLALPAHALSGKEYTLEGCGVTIAMPDDYRILTRESIAADPSNADVRSIILAQYEAQDLYLNALLDEGMKSIKLASMPEDELDCTAFSKEELESMESTFIEGDRETGTINRRYEVRLHPQTKFIKTSFECPEGSYSFYYLQYLTACQNRSYVITMQSLYDPIEARDEKMMDEIIDSMVFHNLPQTSAGVGASTGGYGSSGGGIGELILSLFFTVLIYSMPVALYRYAVRKAPVERPKAKKIVIIYGICAFVVMSALLMSLDGGVAGGSILLWSWINYRMLIGGEDLRPPAEPRTAARPAAPQQAAQPAAPSAPPAPAASSVPSAPAAPQQAAQPAAPSAPAAPQQAAQPAAPSAPPAPQRTAQPAAPSAPAAPSEPAPIRYCRKCGYKLLEDGAFCSNCGAPLVVREAKR